MKLFLVAALFFSMVPCPRAASEDVSAKVDKLLRLMGEDIAFRAGARETLGSMVEQGKIPKAVAAEILKETSEREYLAELGKLYSSKLSESEIDEAIAYLDVTANRTVYQGLIGAYTRLDSVELEARKKTLATRHPEAWKATGIYFRSETSRKISKIQDDSGPLMRKHSVEAFLVAQKSVRERLGIQDPSSDSEPAR